MKNLLNFQEFLNEQYNLDETSELQGFDPSLTSELDVVSMPIKTLGDLHPGTEYVLSVNGKTHSDMIYQGVTNGTYIFNGEEHADEVTFTEDEMISIIKSEGVRKVQQ